MKNFNHYIITLALIFAFCSCSSKKEQTQTSGSGDTSIQQFYKQFDSSVTIEKTTKLKQQIDSMFRWKDVKNKR